MIVGIEQTTDQRHPETRIMRLSSRRHAEKWLTDSGKFAWSGAADKTLPVGQQNFHRRLRSAYVMPSGWRMPSKKRVEEARGSRPWEDRRTHADIVASIAYREKVEEICAP